MPDVEAHITGTVWKIECAVGDSIDEGDTLVILESMKMEMPVEAEDGGTVKEIRAATTGRTRPWTNDELLAIAGAGRGGQAPRP